jgi:hypothetical protein
LTRRDPGLFCLHMKGTARVAPPNHQGSGTHVSICGVAPRRARGFRSRRTTCAFPFFVLFLSALVGILHAYTPLWGYDVFVGSPSESLSLAKLAVDSDTNGYIYVSALAHDSGGSDTIYTWRSTDGGDSWSLAGCLASDSLTGHIRDCELRVGGDAEGTWIYHFVIFDSSSTSGGLWLYRQRPPALPGTWVLIVPGGDTILRLAADRNIEDTQSLFLAWETQSGLVNLVNSNDSGQTWGNSRTAFVGCERPSLCAGGDGCVYVAANARDSAWIGVARYSGNLSDPTPVIAKLDSSGDRRVWTPSVAADRNTPESLQTAIVMYSHKDTAGKITPHFGWSVTGGAYWGSAVWPVTNQNRTTWDARYPCVRRSYDDDLIRAVVTMHEPSKNWDTLVYAYARPGSPTSWEGRATLNGLRASDQYGAKVGYSVAADGGFLAYGTYSGDYVYFDGYHFVGTDDNDISGADPDGLSAKAIWGKPLLQLNLARPEHVMASAFDACGRTVGVLYYGRLDAGNHRLELNARRLKAGVYYLRIRTDSVRRVTKMVLTGTR